ncbi:hypothetical protein JQC92_10515 [Shewanella sp. 202IG2-18]|uniref:hypothetical protein n=1 Tax=Parashewanella hymeniacidonis TaxID=2807618 RepID=UPI00195F9F9E|nr:hypothetical protein [Parashewanella hymeniacidonis]MBM7072461.1 hypothetical protein [Parashewanella hymeniacidonis]
MSKINHNQDPQQKEAFERIEKKVEILEKWASEGIPFVIVNGNKQVDNKGKYVLEFFPSSPTGLRNWNGKQNSKEVVKQYDIPPFTTSAKSLDAIPTSLKLRIYGDKNRLNLWERLKFKAKLQANTKEKNALQELEEKLKVSEANHQGLAYELIELRLTNKHLEDENSTLENQIESVHVSIKSQLDLKKKQLKQSDLKNKQLSIENAKLIKLLDEHGIDYENADESTSIIDFPGK